VLADSEEAEESRIKIFEEYANAGLEIIDNELKGSVDHLERILLFLSSERAEMRKQDDNFDLSNLLSI